VIHVVMQVGPLRCNCSVFGDEQTREAFVVDPGGDISNIQAVLEKHQLKVKAIIITHGHIDHVAGAAKLRALTNAPVYMNQRDSEQLDMLDLQAKWIGVPKPEKVEIDSPTSDGMRLSLGATSFTVIHTPGHTKGSLCLWIPQENKLVAGDTLFRDSIGRTDLPGGDSDLILASIKTRLFDLPDEAIVIPGHGEMTSIGREKEVNPFLQQV
jgi:hydroxyacylglutathione hydrolase